MFNPEHVQSCLSYSHHKPSAEKLKVSYHCGDQEVAPNMDSPDRLGDEGLQSMAKSIYKLKR